MSATQVSFPGLRYPGHERVSVRRSEPNRMRAVLRLAGPPVVVAGGLVAAAAVQGFRVDQYFQEGAIGTYLSAGLLLACAGSAVGILLGRPHAALLWLTVAAGFLYLTADELLQLHERTDVWLHARMGLADTALSDRIDDRIVLGYGLVGLGVMWRCRGEAWLLRQVRGTVVAGFVLFFLMAVCDLLRARSKIT